MAQKRFSSEELRTYVAKQNDRTAAELKASEPHTVIVPGLGGQPITTGRGAICPEATRQQLSDMHRHIRRVQEHMMTKLLLGGTKLSDWQDELRPQSKLIQFNKPQRAAVRASRWPITNFDKRMLRNDEHGFQEAEKAEREQRIMDDLWEGPDGRKHDPLPEGGWEGMRAMPALNEARQGQVLAEQPVIRHDDIYDYYFGIADDDDTGMPAKPAEPKSKGPQALYGRGEPGRHLSAKPGDTYTDNNEGVIYTKQELGWKVTGAMSTNPESPERQSAIAKEARQKK